MTTTRSSSNKTMLPNDCDNGNDNDNDNNKDNHDDVVYNESQRFTVQQKKKKIEKS